MRKVPVGGEAPSVRGLVRRLSMLFELGLAPGAVSHCRASAPVLDNRRSTSS